MKVSITTTHKEGLVVGMRSMPGNPYDGHTLAEALEQAAILCDETPEVAIVDRGYKGVDISTVMTYRSWNVKFLTDVAMYLNLAEQVPLIMVGGFHSCFRMHEAQNSSGTSPMIAAGYYEWEIMVRGEAATGRLSGEALTSARERMKQLYLHGIVTRNIRELETLFGNIDELTEKPVAG